MKFIRYLLVACLLLGSTSVLAIELIERWYIDATFKDPESAAIDVARGVIYVSNVNTFAMDNNGFISRVSLDGKKVELKWITGVHSPTGIAIFASRIYFADVDALVIADANTGAILKRIVAPDAAEQPLLNDVAIAADGTVYVSGRRSRTIYVLRGDELEVWIKDLDLLNLANGLLVDADVLIHGGRTWTTFNIKDKSVNRDHLQPEGLSDFDGIMHDGAGGYLVTSINNGSLWHINRHGTRAITDENLNGIDLDFVEPLLAIPRVGGGLSLFEVEHDNLDLNNNVLDQ